MTSALECVVAAAGARVPWPISETGLTITVTHLPPGTSKWNKIEHRLFAFITQNWRGKPLVR
jgi:Rhodopirellula transposase DDE domain